MTENPSPYASTNTDSFTLLTKNQAQLSTSKISIPSIRSEVTEIHFEKPKTRQALHV